jgi:hypothetical protein
VAGGRPAYADRRPRTTGPEIPEWADPRELDGSVRTALRGLDPRNAEKVALHLVVAGTLVDEDPELALAHARAARDRASRVAAVREAVGVAAYHAGDYSEAARELRAYRRMTGDESYRAVLADIERALGRPEVALRLVAEAMSDGPRADEAAELQLVEAGARRDLGERAAARLVLESALGGRPRPEQVEGADAATLRLAAGYADLLRDEGDTELAERWADAVAAADPENLLGVADAPGVQFWEEELTQESAEPGDPAQPERAEEPDATDDERSFRSFEDDVEAEVAELLGEDGADGAQDEPDQDEPDQDDAGQH